MARWLVRFGYDGAGYSGWARQPGRRTVEGEIVRGLTRFGLAVGPKFGRLEVASRTDRGVSARGNALAVTTRLGGGPLLRALNGIGPELWFTAAREIPEDFPVRRAARRTYRYFEAPDGAPHSASEAAAGLFTGELDVRSFGRAVAPASSVRRTIESVLVRTDPDGGRTLEVRAPSFVWGEVRKIVAALREVDAGRLPVARLQAALRGQIRLTLPLAPPDGLVLWDVAYDQPWTHVWTGPNRRQRSHLIEEQARVWGRSQWRGDYGAPGPAR